MSEYWKSTPKYECKCCRVWLPDTKLARSNHEAGVKHKERYEFYSKKKRDEKFNAERDQKNLQRQLAEIDALAREAVRGDKALGGLDIAFSTAGGMAAPHPSSLHPRGPRKTDDDCEGGDMQPVDNGMYSVRGKSYLEGKKNERHIIKGLGCEIFVEESDDWFRCNVTARREIIIPNTNLMIVSFDVEYYLSSEAGSAFSELQVDSNIRADRLRLHCDASGVVICLNAPPPDPQEVDARELSTIEEHKEARAGAWTTVSIIQYDEEEEERKAAAALVEERRADEASRMIGRAAAVEFNEREDDVLAQYDPYGTNVYKGVRLAEDIVALADTIDILRTPAAGGCTFKKRRANGGGAVRVKTEDDD